MFWWLVGWDEKDRLVVAMRCNSRDEAYGYQTQFFRDLKWRGAVYEVESMLYALEKAGEIERIEDDE